MLLQVTVEVGLLTEAAVTQVALEGLLLVVDVADVALQVGGDAEGAVAVFTPEETDTPRHPQRPEGGKTNRFKLTSSHLT